MQAEYLFHLSVILAAMNVSVTRCFWFCDYVLAFSLSLILQQMFVCHVQFTTWMIFRQSDALKRKLQFLYCLYTKRITWKHNWEILFVGLCVLYPKLHQRFRLNLVLLLDEFNFVAQRSVTNHSLHEDQIIMLQNFSETVHIGEDQCAT